MKLNKIIILAILMGVMLKMTLAVDSYRLDPMNFPPYESRNHHITVSSPGDNILVAIPPGFSLVSGTNSGVGSVDFYVSSPNISSSGQFYYFNISINGSYYNNLIAMSVPDDEIVDNKWELGHGDFNYPDCQYIPDDEVLLFPIIRVWGVATDVLQEPATDIAFSCDFPKIRPRTVDSKYTTDYSDANNLIASGLLESWEGASMFRVFVLSQEVDYNIGDNYEVTCSDLTYNFSHHSIQAQIPDINISVVDSNPFSVTTSTTTNFVEYTISNIAEYEVRDIEFEWEKDGLVLREEKDSLFPGESVRYRVWANDNPEITLTIRQKPCWMFNSRSPVFYEAVHSANYTINSETSEIFSVEEKIFENLEFDLGAIDTYLQNISENMDDLLFLFKINQEEYHIEVSQLPASQQNELNFTCYRLAIQSNGFNINPKIILETNATSESEVIVKNELFETKEFGFTVDPSGFGLVSWDANLGLCTPDNVNNNYVCPITYNYFCAASNVGFKAEAKKETPVKANCVFCKDKVLEIGSKISPTYPAIGFLVIVGIILALIYGYYYFEDDLSLKNWIQGNRRKQERADYLKWRERQRQQQGGRLF